jgi:hypothetical protein
LAHVDPLENTRVFHHTSERCARLPRELLALVSLLRGGGPVLRDGQGRLSRTGGGELHYAGKVRHLLILLPSIHLLHHLIPFPLFSPC